MKKIFFNSSKKYFWNQNNEAKYVEKYIFKYIFWVLVMDDSKKESV